MPIDVVADALLEESYSWADRLATRFAQTYRSGHIFSFILGGIAVCIGPSGFMAPRYRFEFAGIESVITFAIILNAWIGNRNQWHRRWLDYRQLAERLRPMRSLKLLGIAAPDPPGTNTNPVPLRWIDWYASSIWRGIGCPAGSLDQAGASAARPRSPIMRSPRKFPTTGITRSRSSCSTKARGDRLLAVPRHARRVGRDHDRDRLRIRGSSTNMATGSPWSRPASGARHRDLRNPLPGRFRGDAFRSLAPRAGSS